MKVPFLDLKASYNELQEEIESAVLLSLRSGQYIGGPEVEEFERKFADFVNSRFCVGMSNGLDALHLALTALDIGPGDEVIVPSNTFIATWLAVSRVGAVPIPVEPDEKTCNIDVDRIEAAITSRTKAVIPVHLYGQPADIDPVLEIARRHGLYIVEDAAQAHGASYKGERLGGHGDIAIWSFYPGKNLGALGDAGAATTNDASLAEKMQMLRNYGSKQRYVNEVAGHNCRLDPVQAAVLAVKLGKLEEWNARRQRIAARYSDGLSGTEITIPHVENWADPVWHLYCIRYDSRDEMRRLLAEAGVETLIHYPIPPHLQQAYAHLGYGKAAFPIAEKMADTLLSLPIGPEMSDDQVEHVLAALHTTLGRI